MIILIFLIFTNTAFAIGFPTDFLFGVATAPAHVEDELDDIWSDFAKAGKVAAFFNHSSPLKRNEFWTRPNKEIDLTRKLGAQIVRMGIDWGRLFPTKESDLNEDALNHYLKIIQKIKANKQKVMLTLFHHSEPKWILKDGGWLALTTKDHFVRFAKKSLSLLLPHVDYLSIFNEPTVYLMLTKVLGVWPNQTGHHWYFALPGGAYHQALENMNQAYQEIYSWVKEQNEKVQIGNAHNIAWYDTKTWLLKPATEWLHQNMNLKFIKMTANASDFIGLNYYGAEIVSLTGLAFHPEYEYSESGRAIYPKGLYKLAKEIYQLTEKDLFITENGIADRTDYLRPSYLLDHLKVTTRLIEEGVPVLGYIHWTISDNWEWSDGYCPRFGLVDVKRDQNFKRVPRQSFYLYQDIIKNRGFSEKDYQMYAQRLQDKKGKLRSFCRDENGLKALNEPRKVPFKGYLPTMQP